MKTSTTVKKILFVDHVSSKRYGGAEKVLDTLICNLDQHNFSPFLLTSKKPSGQADEGWDCSAIAKIVRINFGELKHSNKLIGIFIFSFRWIYLNFIIGWHLIRLNIDTVMSNTLVSAIYTAPITKILGKKFIYYEHNIVDQRKNSILHRALPLITSLSDKIICISAVVKKSLTNEGVNPKKLYTIHNCLDIKPMQNRLNSREQNKKRQKNNSKKLTIGMVANFIPWKQHKDFINIVIKLAEQLPERDIEAHIIGGKLPGHDEYYREISQLIENYDGNIKFNLHGFVDDVTSWFLKFDVLIHPAEEPFGLVYLEGMFFSCLVVGINQGAAVEIIEDNKTGLLINYNDINRAISKISAVITDKKRYKSITQNAKITINDKFSLANYMQQIHSVME